MQVDEHQDQQPRYGGPAVLDGAAHAVHFYSDHEGLITRLGDYVAEGIAARETCIVIATPAHRAALERRLRAADADIRPKQLIALDAAATLQGFMRSGRPDPELFDATVGTMVRTAAAEPHGMRAYGEMVAVLWACGNAVAALQLEELWNDLLATVRFPLLCAYPSADLHQHAGVGDGIEEICVRHTERTWY